MHAEPDQKPFIVWIKSLEELNGRFLGVAEFVGHAAAEVENDADRHGDVFRRQIHDLLLDVVFEDAKAIAFQRCDRPVVGVSDRYVDERQIYICMDTQPNLLARRVMPRITEDRRLGRR